MPDNDVLLKIPEVAAKLSCHVRSVWRLIAAGELTTVGIGKRMTRVPQSEVKALIERRKSALVSERN